ncbi:FtsQ-type POTRA domain-containing protein [bacterium]|nr:FtsQ-type POTRA domain-containing protein [bacterium]
MTRRGFRDPFIWRIYHSTLFLMVMALMWMVGIKYKQWLSESDLFQIRKIEIEGNELFSDQEILDMGGLDLKADIWKVNLNKVGNQIGGQPFIEQVYIERLFPDILRINILEKHPVALLQFESTFYCIDREGLILPSITGKNYDLPILSGNFKGGIHVGSRVRGNVIGQGLQFINLVLNFCPSIYSQISEVVVGREEGLLLYTNQTTVPVWLGNEEYVRKIHYLKAILVELTIQEKFSQVRYIDLRFGDQVVVGIKA